MHHFHPSQIAYLLPWLFFVPFALYVHVQSVVSGDTLVLVGKANNGPPPEITITLSYVQCPKIARGPSQTDEAFAWESREFLRALCVGKPVEFRVTQTVSSINRTFGDVMLNGTPVVKVSQLQQLLRELVKDCSGSQAVSHSTCQLSSQVTIL